MNLYEVGENIRSLRKKQEMTQEKLAEKMGVSTQAISKWENGHCLPETAQLPKLAKVLVTSIDDLLKCEVEKPSPQKTYIIEPKIIRKGELSIVGVLGNGQTTGQVWDDFMARENKHPIIGQKEDSGYEVRMYNEDQTCDCLVGVHADIHKNLSHYDTKILPDVLYAVFEIYPAKGYESQNSAIDKWVKQNKDKYQAFRFENKSYAIEYYDERFKGNEDMNSVLEIWIPVIKI